MGKLLIFLWSLTLVLACNKQADLIEPGHPMYKEPPQKFDSCKSLYGNFPELKEKLLVLDEENHLVLEFDLKGNTVFYSGVAKDNTITYISGTYRSSGKKSAALNMLFTRKNIQACRNECGMVPGLQKLDACAALCIKNTPALTSLKKKIQIKHTTQKVGADSIAGMKIFWGFKKSKGKPGPFQFKDDSISCRGSLRIK